MNLDQMSWLHRADVVLVAFTLVLLAFAPKLENAKHVVASIVAVAAAIVLGFATQATGEARLALVVVPFALLVGAALLPTAELYLAQQIPEAGALIIVGAIGGIVLTTGQTVLEIALGVEMLSLSATALVALARGQRPLEGAFKYFLLTAVTFATLLFGMSLLFLGTGSFDVPVLANVAEGARPFVYAGGALVAVGLLFKLAAAPVHYGSLDAYTTGPAGLVGFVMVASKLGAAVALTKLAHGTGQTLGLTLVIVGIVTIGIGVFTSFAQTDLRRLLAYSAVAHAGFLAIAAGADAKAEAAYYVVGYGAAALLCFAALAGTGTAPFALSSLKRGGSQPLGVLRASALIIGLASLAGVPPLPGFWVKLAVLLSAYKAFGVVPAALASLGGVVGIIYYLRPVPDLLSQARAKDKVSRPLVEDAVIVVLLVVVIALSVMPNLAWSLSK